MKYNITKIVCLLVFAACFFFPACSKNSAADRPNEPDPPSPLKDSAELLLGKWKLIEDSSTNIDDYYFTEGGTKYYPTPGVYYGKTEDYFDFKANGILDFHANNQSYSTTFELYTDNKLGMGDMVHGKATIITFTATEVTFDLNNTSPNRGKYFRRTYLGK